MVSSMFERKNKVHKLLMVVGAFLLFLGVIGLFSAITGNISNTDGSDVKIADRVNAFFCYAVIFILPGLLLVRPYIVDKQLIKMLNVYLFIVEAQGFTDLNSLAQKVDKPLDIVEKEIKKLTEKQLINLNAYKRDIKQKYVQCSNCIASNLVLIGVPAKCEYCGSPLDTDDEN